MKKETSKIPIDLPDAEDKPRAGSSVTRTARIAQILWSNNDGMMIGKLASGESFKSSFMPYVYKGDCLQIHGKWTEHKKYGMQIDVEHFLYGMPEELEDQDQVKAHEVLCFLHLEDPADGGRLGLNKLGAQIYKTYRLDAKDVVLKNPYQVIQDVKGFGFKNADKMLAKRMGIEEFDERRIDECVYNTLQSASSRESEALSSDGRASSNVGDGHLFLPYHELVARASSQLEVDNEIVEDAITRLASDAPPADHKKSAPWEQKARFKIVDVAIDEKIHKIVYLPYLYAAERGIIDHVSRILKTQPRDAYGFNPDDDIGNIETKDEKGAKTIELSPDQRTAVATAITSKLTVITGGPGVGKTTIVKQIVDICRRKNLVVTLCAPTGKASRRLEEAAGSEAYTIHKLLGYNPRTSQFALNEEAQLPSDVLICDESSMIDVSIAWHLLRALPSTCRLVFVGDVDQLPPVGPGAFFRDLINSGRADVIRLLTIYRQATLDSLIISGSRQILAKEVPTFGTNPTTHDLFRFTASSPTLILNKISELVARKIPEQFGIPTEQIQVIAPAYKGPFGITELNRAIQFAVKGCNPEITRFLTGDRVIQTGHNNYELGVYNGDVGYVRRQDAKHTVVEIDENNYTFTEKDAGHLTLAYAISIHRSQGSEWPAVIVVIPDGLPPKFMNRNMLYTALTRGKRLSILVTSTRTMVIEPIVQQDQAKRYGMLLRLLKET